MGRNKNQESNAVKITRIREINKSARWIVCSAIGVLGIWIVSRSIVEIMKIEQPWYAGIWGAIGLGSIAPAGYAYGWMRKFRGYIKIHGARTARLEASVDADRDSSKLNSDGTGSHDD